MNVGTETLIGPKARNNRRDFLRIAGVMGIVVTAGALAACGGSSEKSKTIKMTKEMTFNPATLTIKRGETVTWKNDYDLVHTATADPSKVEDQTLVELPAGAAAWDSGNIAKDQVWSHTFETPGIYRYVCLPHLMAGMVGEIIVE